jgi:hypothetical protein
MIGTILKLASYTYGPLLGLFAFGILTRRKVDDSRVPLVVLCAPIVCLLLDLFQEQIFASYRIGLELLMVNGALTFAGLWFVSSSIDAAKPDKSASAT